VGFWQWAHGIGGRQVLVEKRGAGGLGDPARAHRLGGDIVPDGSHDNGDHFRTGSLKQTT
jgi:hypothetical protein